MHIVGAQEEEEQENGTGKNIWRNNGGIFSQLDEEHQLTHSESQWTPNNINPKTAS